MIPPPPGVSHVATYSPDTCPPPSTLLLRLTLFHSIKGQLHTHTAHSSKVHLRRWGLTCRHCLLKFSNMACNMIGSAVQQCLSRVKMERIGKFEGNAIGWNSKGLKNLNCASIGKNSVHCGHWRAFCTPVSLEEKFSELQSKKFSKDEESESEDLLEEALLETPSSEELKALLLDSERSNLMKKLSEANQQNRFLKRQVQASEDALVNFKSELAVLELEIRALIGLAQEIANYTIPDGSRKINGKYIQSHLLSRLEAVQEKMDEQIKDVDAAQLQEVPLFWSGMAESVQVMGSFDGWSQGEHLSPEYTDSYTTFSTTLMLRRGRYEIKFLIDGEWQLSPEFPTVGEGLTQNNLLIVE